MNQIALVAGFMPHSENHGSLGRPCLGIDLASVRSAPFEKFVNTYIDLFGKAATLLEQFDGCLHSFEPMIVVGVGIRDRWPANAASPLCGGKLPRHP